MLIFSEIIVVNITISFTYRRQFEDTTEAFQMLHNSNCFPSGIFSVSGLVSAVWLPKKNLISRYFTCVNEKCKQKGTLRTISYLHL